MEEERQGDGRGQPGRLSFLGRVRRRSWAIGAWTAAIIISGLVILHLISVSLQPGDCSTSEGTLSCAGGAAGVDLIRWTMEIGFLILWPFVWWAGFEAIRFVARRHQARERSVSPVG